MNRFNLAFGKNITKLTLVTIAALSSTLGLRTELTIILGDVAVATWIAIGWVFTMICVLAYYKSKQDVEVDVYREYERNRHILGSPPVNKGKLDYSLKIGDPVFLKEVPINNGKEEK